MPTFEQLRIASSTTPHIPTFDGQSAVVSCLPMATNDGFDGSPGEDESHLEVEVHRRADRLRAPQSRGRHAPADVCRQLGVSEATFYIWKKKYAHLGVAEPRHGASSISVT